MPTVAPTTAQIANTRQWIRCRVIAKSAGSEDPVRYSMDRSFKTADFKTADFKTKKWFTNISSGLNYYSMSSS
jgi:hypothetical protein